MIKAGTYASVWDALEDDPVEREKLKMRSESMLTLTRKVKGWKLTQSEAAKRLQITQPRLNDLLRGRFNKFSLDALFELTLRARLPFKADVKLRQTPRRAAE